MSEPIVFISNQRIKEGKLDEYRQYYLEVIEEIKVNKPGTVAHLFYVNEDGRDASKVHVFPDAEALDHHMHGVDEKAKKAYEFMEIVSFEIYGKPSDKVLERMVQIAGSGVALNLKPRHLGGYIRLNSGY